ncbi:hypothetical protein SBI_06787 [Streptomyces bingchenggensis BCW-1]|uniref:Uncharacterized protein n=1 Tax=Streptomyces bingchenggensis (strain BCW-1) TaxID=749414 RepID=D7BZK2_STRBB|nr:MULTISPECIES: hypothetical protein [Streptomyces]ADI09907.1 hypothetical protein SBI_06787 [Streptomyces bingchenggensis BCW-1]
MAASRAPLTRDSLRVKIIVQKVRLAGTEYRVIRPAGPLRNGALYKTHSHYEMYVDRPDGRRIGALWLLAARSPRSLVYLPMRTAPTAPGVGWEDEQPLDLVLAPRTVQLRPSRWKRIRERLNVGNAPRELRTASVPERDLPGLKADCIIPDNPKAANDFLLRKDVYAETLLLTGGTAAFREGAKEIFAVTKDGPPHAATEYHLPGSCNYHVCRPIYDWDLDTPKMRNWEQLHVEFCPQWAR